MCPVTSQTKNNLKRKPQECSIDKTNKKIKTTETLLTDNHQQSQTTFQPKFTKNTRKTSNLHLKPTDTYALQSTCRKMGVTFEKPTHDESLEDRLKRNRRNRDRVLRKLNQTDMNFEEIPNEAPLTDRNHFNHAMDCIRNFELKQMSYKIQTCIICSETRINMKMYKTSNICKRCHSDKNKIKMFSAANNMDPGILPPELIGLSLTEQQLIARISPCINVHLLKHGGIASRGHCVTFPQNVNEPAQIFPRLPKELQIIRVRKQGKNDSYKDFNVRRAKVQTALQWLKKTIQHIQI